jgi:transcriptional regulator with GAF, ATPase, and Fis domain
MHPRTVARVLSEIASTASETLELRDVFDRVATSIRELIPFDQMGVVRIVEGGQVVTHATTVAGKQDPGCFEPCALSSWSPRLRPRSGPNPRINDAEAELDPAYERDAEILTLGVRAALWEPFRSGQAFSGGVWMCSKQPHVFTDEHQEVLGPIAALLGSAVEHWRIWDAERRRGERLARLEELFGALAESLDVRDVFERVSQVVQPVLPHHLFVLTELQKGSRAIRVTAFAGESDGPEPNGPVPLTEEESQRRFLEYEIIDDMAVELAPTTARNRLMLGTGMRAWLRVPVRLWGEVRGSVGFFNRQPSAYGPQDVEVARRIADRIALAISHQRLSEQAHIAVEARESAERLAATVETLTRELEARNSSRIVGESRSWKETLQHVGRVASSETTVLVTGESGTGKEVVSQLVHQGSPRASRPFVAINCAALPEQLLESELFGHEKGAFTGAAATKIGRIEQAAGGTLFLDEIGEMSPLVQAKFLRVLQEREFQRLGGTRTQRADVRVIAATNRDLGAAMARGDFREDLFYRLNVFEIHVPALRDRPDDILPLAEVFLEDLGRTMGRPSAGISRDARQWLLEYAWPGNVRELRNAIERAILLCDGGLITRHHLPAPMRLPAAAMLPVNGSESLAAIPAGGVDLEAVERGFVEKALGQARGNKTRAARLLGLTRAQLYTRLEKYGIH